MSENWVSRFMNIPYKKNGRDLRGCDCYGLVYMVYKYAFSIDLPTYYYVEDESEILRCFNNEIKNWEKVEVPERGDVIYFLIAGQPLHVGVYIGGNEFIHNLFFPGSSSIGNISHKKWKQRIVGFWRYGKHNL